MRCCRRGGGFERGYVAIGKAAGPSRREADPGGAQQELQRHHEIVGGARRAEFRQHRPVGLRVVEPAAQRPTALDGDAQRAGEVRRRLLDAVRAGRHLCRAAAHPLEAERALLGVNRRNVKRDAPDGQPAAFERDAERAKKAGQIARIADFEKQPVEEARRDRLDASGHRGGAIRVIATDSALFRLIVEAT